MPNKSISSSLAIISNGIAILFLVAAFRKPRLARLLFALVFGWACWINYKTAQGNPDDYLLYAAITPLDLYREFIQGWFSRNITTMVTVIAVGQGLIAIGLLLRGWIVRLACIGAIVFFLAIAPLGIGAAFPATLVSCLSMYLILRRDDLKYIWISNTKVFT